MALTREQFQKLRDQGLSVEQITAFESGEKPTSKKTSLRESRPFRDTFTGLGKSLGRTAVAAGSIGRNMQEGVARLVGADLPETSMFDQQSPQRLKTDEFLTPKSKAERVSGFVGDVAQLGIPSTGAAKAVKGLGLVRQILGRGSVGGLTGTLQGGGDIDRDTAIGAITETAFPLAKPVVTYGGTVLKGLAGLVSGKGSDVIEQILKTPKQALEGANAPSREVLKETANTIRGGIKTIRARAGATFESMTKDHTNPLDKVAFRKIVSDFMTDVNESSFISTAKLDKIKGVVDSWGDYSPQGLNKLASKISKFYTGSDAAKDTDRVVSGLNRTIRDWVGEQVPEISEANSKYADKMDLIEQMEALFKTKGAVEGRIGMQKTAEAIGRLFNANKDIAREGVEEIEKELGINILGKEAGRQLVDGVSRSQSAIGDFATGIIKAVIPPKLLLQVVARTGMAKEAVESRINALQPEIRGTVLEVLSDLFGTQETR